MIGSSTGHGYDRLWEHGNGENHREAHAKHHSFLERDQVS